MNIKCINIKHPDFIEYLNTTAIENPVTLAAKLGV